jgi:membrane protease YdiL (CAAX protease family)
VTTNANGLLFQPGIKRIAKVLVWALTLTASALPDILWQVIIGTPPGWLIWIKAALLACALAASLIWTRLHPLRAWLGILLVLLLGLWTINALMSTPVYNTWQKGIGWPLALAAFQGLKLLLSAILVSLLLLVFRNRRAVFLAVGNLRAPVENVFRPRRPSRSNWRNLGILLAIGITTATLLFFGLSGAVKWPPLARALPYVAVAIVMAGFNALNEELQFRSTLLSTLQPLIGKQQALYLMALYFGLAHYFGGSPSGLPGVLITATLGWVFGKAMLETEGLGWGWFLHWLQNIVIYGMWALSAAAAAG